jgi:hypothetical protein
MPARRTDRETEGRFRRNLSSIRAKTKLTMTDGAMIKTLTGRHHA